MGGKRAVVIGNESQVSHDLDETNLKGRRLESEVKMRAVALLRLSAFGASQVPPAQFHLLRWLFRVKGRAETDRSGYSQRMGSLPPSAAAQSAHRTLTSESYYFLAKGSKDFKKAVFSRHWSGNGCIHWEALKKHEKLDPSPLSDVLTF